MTSSRVVVSYARSDGEDFAETLLDDLPADIGPFWMDRQEMAGDDRWWQQIKDAIEGSMYLVAVMTPGAVASDITRQEWLHARRNADLSLPTSEPNWLDRPALNRITVSSPTIAGWFDHINHSRPYGDRVKPCNFLLVAHPDPHGGGDAMPVAPYDPVPRRWLDDLDWIDRRTGQPVTITTDPPDGTTGGPQRVRTYRDVLAATSPTPKPRASPPTAAPSPDTPAGSSAGGQSATPASLPTSARRATGSKTGYAASSTPPTNTRPATYIPTTTPGPSGSCPSCGRSAPVGSPRNRVLTGAASNAS